MNEKDFFENMRFKLERNAWLPFESERFNNVEVFDTNRLFYISGGAMEWTIDDERVSSDPRSLVLIPSNKPVMFRQLTKKIHIAYFTFYATYNGNCIFDYIRCPYKVSFDGDEMEEVVGLFNMAEPNHDNPNVAETLRVRSVVLQVLSLYLAKGKAEFLEEPQIKNDIVKKIIDEVETHPERSFTLQDFSELTHVHPSYISRVFKREMGISPMKYANSVRLRKVTDLLRDSDCSVNLLADQFGFSAPETLSRFIKQHTGMAPTDYRRYIRTKKIR